MTKTKTFTQTELMFYCQFTNKLYVLQETPWHFAILYTYIKDARHLIFKLSCYYYMFGDYVNTMH